MKTEKNLNKEIKIIKKEPEENYRTGNITAEIKRLLDKTVETTEVKISELEDRSIDFTHMNNRKETD